MAGQAKRDPATQCVACRRDVETLSDRADARPLGGRLKAGHDD
jgi:hypothetical protein